MAGHAHDQAHPVALAGAWLQEGLRGERQAERRQDRAHLGDGDVDDLLQVAMKREGLEVGAACDRQEAKQEFGLGESNIVPVVRGRVAGVCLRKDLCGSIEQEAPNLVRHTA